MKEKDKQNESIFLKIEILVLSFCSLFYLCTFVVSIGCVSFFSRTFNQIPYKDLYGDSFLGYPRSSTFISFISLIFLYIFFRFKLPTKYLLVVVLLEIIVTAVNFSFLQIVSPKTYDKNVEHFMKNYHKYDSILEWSETVAHCINTSLDEHCGFAALQLICCDDQIKQSITNRFVDPYEPLKTFIIFRTVSFVLEAIVFVVHLFLERLREKNES